MQTGIVTNTSSSSATGTSAVSKTLDKNAFLQLLCAQLSHQDPTQGQDTNQMVQQLTSYSQLEQSQNTNTLLSGLQTQNAAIFQTQAAGLIGKKVKVNASSITLKDGVGAFDLNLGGAAASTTFTVKDASGKTVATFRAGALPAGTSAMKWDGLGNDGKPLPDGTYTVAVNALDANGKAVSAASSTVATVSSVKFVDGKVVVIAGGQSFDLSDITQISA